MYAGSFWISLKIRLIFIPRMINISETNNRCMKNSIPTRKVSINLQKYAKNQVKLKIEEV